MYKLQYNAYYAIFLFFPRSFTWSFPWAFSRSAARGRIAYFPQSLGTEQKAFRASNSLSSLDIIKLAHLYDTNPICKKTVEELNQKSLKSYYCENNSDLPVLESKICDNKLDCPGGQDEDGTLASCKRGAVATSGCCLTYIVGPSLDHYDLAGVHDGENIVKPFYRLSKTGFENDSKRFYET